MFRKLEAWAFYFFLFALPISLRHVFNYDPFQFIEWRSFYIYGTDLVLALLLVFWAFESKKSWLNFKLRPKDLLTNSDFYLLVFVAIAAISVKNSLFTGLAWFHWLKLVEGVALYFYIKNYALNRFDFSFALIALVVGGVMQSLIAITQFMLQSSLGLKYLGESVLAPTMSGVAAFYVNGIKIMRAYGTTPHSNVVASYLFVAIGAFYNLAIYLHTTTTEFSEKPDRRLFGVGVYRDRRWWWHIFHVVILWAFFLTFSRTIIIIWGLTFIIHIFLIRFSKFKPKFWDKKEMRSRGLKIFVTTLAVGTVFLMTYWPYVTSRLFISGQDDAIQLRVLYNREALASGHNWFGVGIGNFVPWLMKQDLHLSRGLYQPVHNIYLLIYAETGIIGIAVFLLFLALVLYRFVKATQFKKLYHFSLLLIWLSLLAFGLFDHFLWTLQSGQLLFWLVTGLVAGTE